MNARERRLSNLEWLMGANRIPPITIFLDAPMYKDEPDTLIVGARLDRGDFFWKRTVGEDVKAFQERISQDVVDMGQIGVVLLERDHLYLPEPSEGMPAYTAYSEVVKGIP